VLPTPSTSRLKILAGDHKGTLFLSVVLTLGGCGSLPTNSGFSHWGDGAPNRYVDVSAIPDAEPQIVPYSRYGNPDTYVVNGRRYRVLKTSAQFQQQGIASWYGTKFHGHKTSSGEPYDMYAMTAAHKSLPLPTWLEVTNRNNGKKVIVKVNDRGPFIGDRILDLSYAAAAKLGVTDTGTAPVTIRAIDPAQYLARKRQSQQIQVATTAVPPVTSAAPVQATPSAPPGNTDAKISPPAAVASVAVAIQPPDTMTVAAAPAAATIASAPAIAGFYLQVAAFSDRQNAEQLRQKLLTLKPDAIQIDSTPESGNRYYRVRIGPLSSLSEAGKLAAQVTLLGLGEPKILLD